MKYTVKVKGSASIKGKVFKGGKDFTQDELGCNKKEIDQLIKDGIICEAKEPEKVISELEKVSDELATANEALKAKDSELEKVSDELATANEALKKAQDELKTLKAKK